MTQQDLQGVPLLDRRPVHQTGAAQEPSRAGAVLRRPLGQDDPAAVGQRLGEPVGGVTEPGAALEDVTGADRSSQEEKQATHQRTDDRKMPAVGETLHLQRHSLAGGGDAAQVLIDGRVDDVHGKHLSTPDHPRPRRAATSMGVCGNRSKARRHYQRIRAAG